MKSMAQQRIERKLTKRKRKLAQISLSTNKEIEKFEKDIPKKHGQDFLKI